MKTLLAFFAALLAAAGHSKCLFILARGEERGNATQPENIRAPSEECELRRLCSCTSVPKEEGFASQDECGEGFWDEPILDVYQSNFPCCDAENLGKGPKLVQLGCFKHLFGVTGCGSLSRKKGKYCLHVATREELAKQLGIRGKLENVSEEQQEYDVDFGVLLNSSGENVARAINRAICGGREPRSIEGTSGKGTASLISSPRLLLISLFFAAVLS
ncbi:hypothetical protein ERJ75_001449200 [Trypanosoma vivax]|nr:hypothetical protein TRVL_10243 [Trypanosoma vivax]KAH8606993.1 hypothetical protein ERJ75_001449200 [Trypanosoma vivax]